MSNTSVVTELCSLDKEQLELMDRLLSYSNWETESFLNQHPNTRARVGSSRKKLGLEVQDHTGILILGWCHHLKENLYHHLDRGSVQFNCPDVSNSLQPHGLQHSRLPCPSPTSGAYSNSCPSSWWCYPTISSSIVPFFSCLQSFPESGSFQMNQLFTSGFSFSISPSNEYSGLISFRMDWLDLLAV